MTWPEEPPSPGPGEKVRDVYPLFVNKTVYEGQRKDAPDKRVLLLTRCAFLGQQRYAAATWSGDIGNSWESLKRQITAGLGYTASGLPYWTTDAGGFFRPGPGQYTDPAYHERFLRWFQFATFSPLQRVHGYQTDTEPWRYGDAGRDVRCVVTWTFVSSCYLTSILRRLPSPFRDRR